MTLKQLAPDCVYLCISENSGPDEWVQHLLNDRAPRNLLDKSRHLSNLNFHICEMRAVVTAVTARRLADPRLPGNPGKLVGLQLA